MAFLLIDHLVSVHEPAGPEEAGGLFDEIVREILPTGRSGQALWIRPRGEDERGDGPPRGARVPHHRPAPPHRHRLDPAAPARARHRGRRFTPS
ncbi:hypothetical protein [Actinomadura sp. K4S16]|uniref:hypothetical protein n=1 Tax=Actinomadura sp. K4S16 TaxID=1316147 RepID=UPI0011ED356A|nr:hypothetical protein [Actinomadura sp. K4S16]